MPSNARTSNAATAATGAAPVCVDPEVIKPRLEQYEVIDVRTAGEFESMHVPMAKNRPLDELDRHQDEIRELVQQGRDVVLVCRSGARAHQAQDQLAAAGLPALPILEGGMVAWEAADGEVVRDVIRWDLERQVRFVAGLLVALSIATSIVFPPARYVAGFIGLGLTFAALTNTCAMGIALSRLPYNRPRTSSTA